MDIENSLANENVLLLCVTTISMVCVYCPRFIVCGGCANSHEYEKGHMTCDDVTTYAYI
jgi:hypothetical protein